DFTFSATGLPSGLSIDSATGLISGTIADDADEAGPYSVTVTATDGELSASQTFTWAVNYSAIILSNPGEQVNLNDDTVDLSITATNATSTALTYSATGLPDGLAIDPDTGEITGTIDTTADSDTPFTVTITATDSIADTSASQTFTWTVGQAVVTLDEP